MCVCVCVDKDIKSLLKQSNTNCRGSLTAAVSSATFVSSSLFLLCKSSFSLRNISASTGSGRPPCSCCFRKLSSKSAVKAKQRRVTMRESVCVCVYVCVCVCVRERERVCECGIIQDTLGGHLASQALHKVPLKLQRGLTLKTVRQFSLANLWLEHPVLLHSPGTF